MKLIPDLIKAFINLKFSNFVNSIYPFGILKFWELRRVYLGVISKNTFQI